MEFYYQFLSGKAQRTYRCIEQGIKNQRKNILLLGCFSEPYATELVKLVSYDHPELFYVNYSKLSYLQGTLGFTAGNDMNKLLKLLDPSMNPTITIEPA